MLIELTRLEAERLLAEMKHTVYTEATAQLQALLDADLERADRSIQIDATQVKADLMTSIWFFEVDHTVLVSL